MKLTRDELIGINSALAKQIDDLHKIEVHKVITKADIMLSPFQMGLKDLLILKEKIVQEIE